MDRGKVEEEIGKLAEQIKRIIHYSMEKNGVNDKINENTLVDSHVYEDLEVNEEDVELIKVLIHDYYVYIESGMKAGHWVDAEYLLPWMIDKNIPTDNDTLWHIQDSIYRFGISPRPFLDEAWDDIDEYWDGFAEGVFAIMMEDIDDFFEN